MGDDWCRMRLRENADPIEVKRLIDDQALAFRQGHDGLLDDLLTVNQDRLQTLEQRKEARQRYIDTSRILIRLLHIRAFDETYQYQPGDKAECMRMSFIGRNDIFPAEWRLAAYRTVLPEEVETRLSEWERYIKAVREGGYRGYLLEWYLYTESHKAEQFWQELQLAINQMRQRTNAWAQRLLSTELPDQIAMLPTLTTYPPRAGVIGWIIRWWFTIRQMSVIKNSNKLSMRCTDYVGNGIVVFPKVINSVPSTRLSYPAPSSNISTLQGALTNCSTGFVSVLQTGWGCTCGLKLRLVTKNKGGGSRHVCLDKCSRHGFP